MGVGPQRLCAGRESGSGPHQPDPGDEGTSCEFGLYDPAVNNEDRYATCSRRGVDRLAGRVGPKLKPLPQGFLSRLVLRQADEVGELLLWQLTLLNLPLRWPALPCTTTVRLSHSLGTSEASAP